MCTSWFSSLFFQSEHRPNLTRRCQIVYDTIHQESMQFRTIRKLLNGTFIAVKYNLSILLGDGL